MITIPVSRGVTTIVEDEDADLALLKWSYGKNGYPSRTIPGRRGTPEYLHRVVLERKLQRKIEKGMVAHHINGDVLDNRRNNLKEITHAENMQNRRFGTQRIVPGILPARKVKSGIVGVYPSHTPGRWTAQITYKGKTYCTESFDTPEQAEDARGQLKLSLIMGIYNKEPKTRKVSEEERARREDEKGVRKNEWKQRRVEILRDLARQKRRYSFQRYDEGSRETITVLPLANGKETIIDSIDANLDEHCWQVKDGYAARTEYGSGDRYLLHRIILERKLGRPIAQDAHTDHINRNRLDNRRNNLREVTSMQNSHNHGMRSDNTTGYIGIQYKKETGIWRAEISRSRGGYIGKYDTREDAAAAYDQAILETRGEFAYTNNSPFQMTLWGYAYTKWERSEEAKAQARIKRQEQKRHARVEELREKHKLPTATNTHGYRGVKRDRDRWRAEIGVNYKKVFLGNYDTPEEASRVYQDAKEKLRRGEIVTPVYTSKRYTSSYRNLM